VRARSSYRYDASYQLIEASAREVAPCEPGPGTPKAAADATRLSNYTRSYQYDAAGNLTRLRHRSRASHASFSQTWSVAPHSNRAIPQDPAGAAVDVGKRFDARGNLLELQPGQPLDWNARGQLQRVAPVCRAQGRRIRKITERRAKGVCHREEVRYLPGLELRENSATGEHLQVFIVAGTGLRLLRWVQGPPSGMPEIQARYSFLDQLGSSVMELDGKAQTLSYEEYYPFGGTALWVPASALQAKYKAIRYSGKERDATGLYAYGFRYYAPWLARWLARWLNPDPAGPVDGPNLFRMARNNPVSWRDPDGRLPVRPHDEPPPLPRRPPPAVRPGGSRGNARPAFVPAIPPRRRPSAAPLSAPASPGAISQTRRPRREVAMNEMVQASGAEELFTQGLSDCTAVAILSDLDLHSGIWRERYVGHLLGSNLQMPMNQPAGGPTAGLTGGEIIEDIVDRLTPGKIKVILGFGIMHESSTGRSITITQEFKDNRYPLARLVRRAGSSRGIRWH
jgi:RHS repeat-associated protein